jgi:hypothetical protein
MAIHVSAPSRGFAERYEVDSFDPRRTGTAYVVSFRENGVGECSCPHWKFRRGGPTNEHPELEPGQCKHIAAVLESRRREREPERAPARRPRRSRPEQPEPLEERTPVRREPVTVGDEQFRITRIQALKEEMEA